MVVKIHGLAQSTCTQRISVVLKELNIPYEIVPVNVLEGEHKTEAYLQNKQPFGQIPVLEDDGFQLFESRAIGRYLAAKYGNGKLLPKDLKANALFEQAASIEQNDFEPFAQGIAIERVFKKIRGLETDEKKAAELQETLEQKLKGYEILLGKTKYLAGDEVTLADLFHLPHGWIVSEKLDIAALKSDSLPNVKRWWADITSRQSWKDVQAELAQA